jgi:hypothetical protein
MYALTSLGQAQAGADCSGWERDPQSFGKIVAEHYVRTVLGQALSATLGPARVTAWTWRVGFPNDIAVYVSFEKVPNFVAAAQWYPKPAKPTRYYTYHCTQQGQLVLSERQPP